MIKFIYFDLGGVVVSQHATHARIAKEMGVSEVDIRSFLDQTDVERVRGTGDAQVYMKKLKDTLHFDHPAKDFADFWSDYLMPIQETHDFIHELVSQYALGIFSNAERGVINHNIRKGKVPNIAWHAVIESAQYGIVKPEQKIYEIAQDAAGFSPSEIFFIDDKKENIDVALSLGWQGIVFDPHKPKESIARVKTSLTKCVV